MALGPRGMEGSRWNATNLAFDTLLPLGLSVCPAGVLPLSRVPPGAVPCFDSRCPPKRNPQTRFGIRRYLAQSIFPSSCLPGLQFVDDGLRYTRRIFLLHIPTFPYDIKLSRRRNGNRCLGLRVSCMTVSLPMSFVFAYLATLPSHVSPRYKYYTSVIRPLLSCVL